MELRQLVRQKRVSSSLGPVVAQIVALPFDVRGNRVCKARQPPEALLRVTRGLIRHTQRQQNTGRDGNAPVGRPAHMAVEAPALAADLLHAVRLAWIRQVVARPADHGLDPFGRRAHMRSGALVEVLELVGPFWNITQHDAPTWCGSS